MTTVRDDLAAILLIAACIVGAVIAACLVGSVMEWIAAWT